MAPSWQPPRRARYNPAMPRRGLIALGAPLAAVVALAGPASGSRQALPERAVAAQALVNPCLGPAAASLRCPDLIMRPPFDLTIDRHTRPGRVLLRAANSIDNVGTGPAELRGRRVGRVTMAVRQRIYRTDGSRLSVPTGGRLTFYPIPGQYRYWKFRDAARFELWTAGDYGERRRLVRVGPKVHYCLRDLRRTRPSRRSPRRPVYPGCDQSPRTRRVTLGTSVGWSDIYPASYHEQWIDVTGLRGRFAFVHIADPENGIHESNEHNNEGRTIVDLPFGPRHAAGPHRYEGYAAEG